MPSMSASSAIRSRILPQQRQQPRRRRADPARKRSNAAKRRVGIFRARQSARSAPAPARQDCARACSPRSARYSAGRASGAPRSTTSCGCAKAHLRRAGRASRDRHPRPENDRFCWLARQRGRLFEQLRIMALHLAQVLPAGAGECVAVRRSRGSARNAPSASGSAGSVWVCSSATICSRCSTARRKSIGRGQRRRGPPRRSSRRRRARRALSTCRGRAIPDGGRRRSVAGSARRTRSRGCRRGRA